MMKRFSTLKLNKKKTVLCQCQNSVATSSETKNWILERCRGSIPSTTFARQLKKTTIQLSRNRALIHELFQASVNQWMRNNHLSRFGTGTKILRHVIRLISTEKVIWLLIFCISICICKKTYRAIFIIVITIYIELQTINNEE